MDPIDLICFRCKHFTPGEGGCKAFPMDDHGNGGIPEVILSGKNRHTKPLNDQGNRIVFESIQIEQRPETVYE